MHEKITHLSSFCLSFFLLLVFFFGKGITGKVFHDTRILWVSEVFLAHDDQEQRRSLGGRHIFGRKPKPRAAKPEIGIRARKVSDTQEPQSDEFMWMAPPILPGFSLFRMSPLKKHGSKKFLVGQKPST